ncbi:GAF domain-containing protein [Clostridioides mangenotii]|uniref:GAF domain-containing protein n=1 Tax=Metaclostridioides mangenotii TaxID=1540 RepID=UPI00214A19BC|nr:GAF domain-containing protein [Clostridioides mangenotii]MCR1956002.1 GAF domain-containing protein [Clostridioides mangenotii]
MNYKLLANQAIALLENEQDLIANTANISALLYELIEDINWIGFYFVKNNKLVLGPFQGKVACTKIEIGKGVCGTCVQTKQTQRINDVHAFPGHIACDSASNAELVIPLVFNGEVKGVLDIDSIRFSRFTEEDQIGLENLVSVIMPFLYENI